MSNLQNFHVWQSASLQSPVLAQRTDQYASLRSSTAPRILSKRESSDLFDQLEPRVVSLNISAGGIPKRPIDSVRVTFAGLEGDKHNHAKHDRPEQAVSLQDIEKLEELNALGYRLDCGTTGENLNISNLNINELSIGTLLHFENGVQLRLTKVRQPCYVLDSISLQLKKDILGRCGFYAEVVNEGIVHVNEKIQVYLPNLVGVF